MGIFLYVYCCSSIYCFDDSIKEKNENFRSKHQKTNGSSKKTTFLCQNYALF